MTYSAHSHQFIHTQHRTTKEWFVVLRCDVFFRLFRYSSPLILWKFKYCECALFRLGFPWILQQIRCYSKVDIVTSLLMLKMLHGDIQLWIKFGINFLTRLLWISDSRQTVRNVRPVGAEDNNFNWNLSRLSTKEKWDGMVVLTV